MRWSHERRWQRVVSDVEPHTSRHWESEPLDPLVAEAVALARGIELEPDARFFADALDLLKGRMSAAEVVEQLRLRVRDAEAIAGLNFAEEFVCEGRGWAEADADGNLVCFGPDGQRLPDPDQSNDRPAPGRLDGDGDLS